MPTRPTAAPYGASRIYPRGYAATIAELTARQGEIAAEGAARSGAIWGPTVAGLGQAAGQYLQQRQEQKTQEKRRAAFENALGSFDPADPMKTYRELAVTIGPEPAAEVVKGIASIRKLQTDAEPNFDDLRQTVSGLYETMKAQGPEYMAQRWPVVRDAIAPAVKKRLKIDIPLEWNDETAKGIEALHQAWNAPKGAEGALVETVDAAGRPVKRRATEEELAAGVPLPPEKLAASYQAKEVLDDEGKPVMANFDVHTGRYINSATGKPIANPRPVPSASETQDSRKFKQAAPILAAVSELSEKINTLQGVSAKAAGAAAKAAAELNLNDNVAEYESLISGFTPLVARALGHTGVLTEQDVQSVKALFPRPGDSKSLRDRKVARIKSIISQLESGGAAPVSAAGAPADGGWTELPGGIRIREKK